MSICDFSPEEILFLEIVFTIILIDGRSADELNVLGSALNTVGAALVTHSAAMDCPQNSKKNNAGGDDDNDKNKDLENTIADLKHRLAELEKKYNG
jgi:hypothetical protein